MSTALVLDEAQTKRQLAEKPALRVLVVEDDVEMASAIAEVLRRDGCEVDVAPDGLRGLACAALKDYGVVISDVRMPGLNGLELVEFIARQETPPPTILMTAYPEWKVGDQAVRAGVREVWVKPLSLKLLARRVRELGGGPGPVIAEAAYY